MAPRVNAVVNAHTILKQLSNQTAPTGVTEIAEKTDISASSCYNILKTLVELRLASFDPRRKTYELGTGILELARTGMTNVKIQSVSEPVLRRLAEKYQCQAGLWELADGTRTLIQISEVESIAKLSIQEGLVMPAGAGSAGKSFMVAHRHDRVKLSAAFKATNWRGQIDFAEYCADVDKASNEGYSVDKDSLYPGITTISSAFEDNILGRQYCISIFLLSAACPANSIRLIGAEVATARQKIHDAYLRK